MRGRGRIAARSARRTGVVRGGRGRRKVRAFRGGIRTGRDGRTNSTGKSCAAISRITVRTAHRTVVRTVGRTVAGTALRSGRSTAAGGRIVGSVVVRRFGLGRQFGFDEAQRSDLVGRQALALGAVALDADEFVDVDLVRGRDACAPL